MWKIHNILTIWLIVFFLRCFIWNQSIRSANRFIIFIICVNLPRVDWISLETNIQIFFIEFIGGYEFPQKNHFMSPVKRNMSPLNFNSFRRLLTKRGHELNVNQFSRRLIKLINHFLYEGVDLYLLKNSVKLIAMPLNIYSHSFSIKKIEAKHLGLYI